VESQAFSLTFGSFGEFQNVCFVTNRLLNKLADQASETAYLP